jgi:hypothetical protein
MPKFGYLLSIVAQKLDELPLILGSTYSVGFIKSSGWDWPMQWTQQEFPHRFVWWLRMETYIVSKTQCFIETLRWTRSRHGVILFNKLCLLPASTNYENHHNTTSTFMPTTLLSLLIFALERYSSTFIQNSSYLAVHCITIHSLEVMIFQDVPLCSLVGSNLCFRVSYYFHHKSSIIDQIIHQTIKHQFQDDYNLNIHHSKTLRFDVWYLWLLVMDVLITKCRP